MKNLIVMLLNQKIIIIKNLEHIWIEKDWWTLSYDLRYQDSVYKSKKILKSRNKERLYDAINKVISAYWGEEEFLDLRVDVEK